MKLTENEIQNKLKEINKEWKYINGHLKRKIIFKNFIEAFSFMNIIALHSEKINHHPNWFNSYKILEIELYTHDTLAVTNKDFELARIIDLNLQKFI